jgi:DNA-binding NarL/FixJ family response regulator
MSPISVLLVDDNPTFLRIAADFLRAHEEVAVVGTASGGEEAVARAQHLRPQVVLLDLLLPDLPGLEVIPRLRSELPEVGIIAVTLMNDDGYRRAALAADADEFIPKAALNTDLMPAIRNVAETRCRSQNTRGTDQGEQCDPAHSGGGGKRWSVK